MRLRWLGHLERKTEEDVVMRTWKAEVNGTTKDRKAKTEVERCYTKRREGDRSTDRRSSRTENLENENAICRPQHWENAEEENKMIHKKYGKSRRKRRGLRDRETERYILVCWYVDHASPLLTP